MSERSRTISNVPDKTWETFSTITSRGDTSRREFSCVGQANYLRYLLRLHAEVRRQGIHVEFTPETADA